MCITVPVFTLTIAFTVVSSAPAAPFRSLAAMTRVYVSKVSKSRLLADTWPDAALIVNLSPVFPSKTK